MGESMTRRVSILVALAFAAVTGGCNCNEDPLVQTVSVTAPSNGAKLTMKNDADNAKDGLQVAVTAKSTGFKKDGTKATLSVDGTVEQPDVAMNPDGTFTFSNVTLTKGTHVLSVVATDANGTAEGKAALSADDTALAQCTVAVAAPAEGEVLNAAADKDLSKAGLQAIVDVRAAGCPGASKVRVCVEGSGLTGSPCNSAPGVEIAEMDLSTTNLTSLKSDLPEGTVKIAAELDDGAGVFAAEPVTVFVDTVVPTCKFSSPKDAATVTESSIAVELEITDAEEGQTVEVKSSLKDEPATGTVGAGGTSATISGVNLPVGEQLLTAKVADKAGNEASCTASVSVDFDGCDVVFADPATTNFVLNRANANPTGSPLVGSYTIRGRTTRCANGTASFTRIVGTTRTIIGTTPVDDAGNFSLKVTFADGQSGQINVTIEKTGIAPNSGASLDYRADFTAPTCSFASPTQGAVVTTQTPVVQISTTGAEQGREVVMTSTRSVTETKANVDANGNATLNPSLDIGAQTLTARLTDLAGNSGSCTVDISVDIAGCDVVVTDPTLQAIFNVANSAPAGSPLTGAYTIKASTTRCAGGTVTITKTVGATTTVLATTLQVQADGTFSYQVPFADGESDAKINLKIAKAGMTANAGVDIAYCTDFTPPQLVDAIPALGDLFVVNASNPNLGPPPLPGYVQDGSAATAGGQVAVNLTATGIGTNATAGFCNALRGSAKVFVTTTDPLLSSSSVTDNGTQTVAGTVTLAEGLSGPVTILLTDAAGNTLTRTWNARVSTTPMPTIAFSKPPPAILNVYNDKGSNRATFATIDVVVTYATTVPTNATIKICSTLQKPGAAACASGGGYFEVASKGASGNGAIFSAVDLPMGQQQVRAELVDVLGALSVTAPAATVVDTIPPRVLSIALAQDANNDNVVSLAELGLNQAATFNVTFEGVEDGRTATLLDGTTPLGNATVTGNAATFSVSGLLDGAHNFRVLVKDAAGNPNDTSLVPPQLLVPVVNATAFKTITFSRTPPSISVAAPSFAVCNVARDEDPTSVNTCEVTFDVAVGASTSRVVFSLTGAGSITTATTVDASSFVSGHATAVYSLAQTTSGATLVATAYDATGNGRQATHAISLVDTLPPTLTIVSPTPDQTVYSQTVAFSATTNAEVGQLVTVKSLLTTPNPTVGSDYVVAGTPNSAAFNLSLPYGNQTLSATVTDAAGNVSTAAFVAIQMNVLGCDVNFTNPSTATTTFNATSAPGGVVTLTGYSTRGGCTNKQIDFFVEVDGGPSTPAGSATTDGSGNFTKTMTFGDGTVTIVTALSTVTSSTPNIFTAITDITPPTLVVAPLSASPAIPDVSNNLYVVAPVGNLRIGQAGYYLDEDGATDDGQVTFSFTATGAGPSAGTGTGKVQVFLDTTEKYALTPQSTTNAAQVLTPQVNLTQGFEGSLKFVATDAALNKAEVTWHVAVDVVRPPVPQFVMSDPGDGNYSRFTNYRKADLALFVTTPADSGIPARSMTWDVGYTSDFKLGTTPFDEASFDNTTLYTTKIASLGTAGAAGTVASATLAGLPTENLYRVAPRIIDGLGNRSAFASTQFDARWRTISLTYPGPASVTAAAFGSVIVGGGDANGDGYADFAVSAPSYNAAAPSPGANQGAVFVYYGVADGANPALAAPVQYTGAANSNFGLGLAMGDVDGDGRADLLIRSASGVVSVYLAPAPPNSNHDPLPTTPTFTFSASGTNPKMSRVAILPDINGDGRNEIVMSSPSTGNVGQVVIFFGRLRADWPANVDTATANIVINGSDSTTFYFGTSVSFGGSPDDLDEDGKGDLFIPVINFKKLYLFSGATLMAGYTGSQKVITCNETSATQLFYDAAGPSFGGSVAFSKMGGKAALYVGDSGANKISYFERNALPATPPFGATQNAFATGSNAFAVALRAADLNGDGLGDLAAGSLTSNPVPGDVSLFFSGGSTYPPKAEAVLHGNPSFGMTLTPADVVKDAVAASTPDLIIGEPNNGNGRIEIHF